MLIVETIACIKRAYYNEGKSIRLGLALFDLTTASKWRHLTRVNRTPGTWTAHIPNHSERNAQHALKCSRAYGLPPLP